MVDGQGMTVYYYDKDTKGSGTSACEGECTAAWPAVHAASADPEVDGVTGEVGTITGVDGELQVTVDGRPVYTYAADTGPGDVTGQGVNGVWHVVAPDGTEIMDAAPPPGRATDRRAGRPRAGWSARVGACVPASRGWVTGGRAAASSGRTGGPPDRRRRGTGRRGGPRPPGCP